MRPFAKDSQPVVIKGRRKSKLAAKSKSTAALLVKRKKTNNARRKQNDGADDLAKESCQFVPVRRKPLGEYMKLEVSTSKNNSSSPSPSLQGMRMSYAAAIATYPTAGAAGVKVMISPRLKRANKAPTIKVDGSGSGSGSATSKTGSKITADRKFRIFDETPKPHIVRVDAKAERTERAEAAANRTGRVKSSKATVDAEANALGVKFKRLAYNSAARNLNSSQVNAFSASSHVHVTTSASSTASTRQKSFAPALVTSKPTLAPTPTFSDSVSYLSYHRARLQHIIKRQAICAISLQSPEPMKIPQFEDKHFKYLEEAALLAQNRTMLRLWLNSDQLIC